MKKVIFNIEEMTEETMFIEKENVTDNQSSVDNPEKNYEEIVLQSFRVVSGLGFVRRDGPFPAERVSQSRARLFGPGRRHF